MAYWLNLFNGTTWQEFRDAGGEDAGFQDTKRKGTLTKKVRPGDIFVCYMTGVGRWVGLLQITGELFRDDTAIHQGDSFPLRFPVKPLIILPAEHGVPMKELEGKLSGYPTGAKTNKWTTLVRESLRQFDDSDGEAIAAAIRSARANPQTREVDPKKLGRPITLYKRSFQHGDQKIETVVSVPSVEDDDAQDEVSGDGQPATHSEIQWRLLDLGAQMGLNVWAPRSDRARGWNGKANKDIPRMLLSLPTQFDAATTSTIENIDVLWLNGNAIVAAFEVEHSTSIYSGLLRMSDLLTMQPNIDIKLYLVGPDERFTKFTREVPRPTFASRPKPLHTVCWFLPYSKLCERLDGAKSFLKHLKPEFLDDIAVLYDPKAEVDE